MWSDQCISPAARPGNGGGGARPVATSRVTQAGGGSVRRAKLTCTGWQILQVEPMQQPAQLAGSGKARGRGGAVGSWEVLTSPDGSKYCTNTVLTTEYKAAAGQQSAVSACRPFATSAERSKCAGLASSGFE